MTTILNRRNFFRQSSALLAAAQADSLLRPARAAGSVPVGLSLFMVEAELAKDFQGTIRAVAQMGYQVVEFWGFGRPGPFDSWTTEQAKGVRKLLDDLGIRCHSTHCDGAAFSNEGLAKTIELNHIIGSKDLVMSGNNMGGGATSGKASGGLDGSKRVADRLNAISEKLKPAGLRAGYHNHPYEFTPIDGKLPMDVIAANTPKEVMLQLCVGAATEAHGDPVKFIKANPGRIRHIHLKDWAPGPDKGHEVLFGEGISSWPQIFAAAESVGGAEFYLMVKVGNIRNLEIARRSLANYKKLRG